VLTWFSLTSLYAVYSDVHSCPEVGGLSGGWGQAALRLAGGLLGVCHINEALFRRSAVHKRHLQFTLKDVANLDRELARNIIKDARVYMNKNEVARSQHFIADWDDLVKAL
jgi:hypothetical protein